jgi:hypothetical protein
VTELELGFLGFSYRTHNLEIKSLTRYRLCQPGSCYLIDNIFDIIAVIYSSTRSGSYQYIIVRLRRYVGTSHLIVREKVFPRGEQAGCTSLSDRNFDWPGSALNHSLRRTRTTSYVLLMFLHSCNELCIYYQMSSNPRFRHEKNLPLLVKPRQDHQINIFHTASSVPHTTIEQYRRIHLPRKAEHKACTTTSCARSSPVFHMHQATQLPSNELIYRAHTYSWRSTYR